MPVPGDRPRVRNLFDLVEDEDALEPDPGPAEVPVWDGEYDEPHTTDYIRDLLDLWHGEHEGLVLVTDWREELGSLSLNGHRATPRKLDMRPLLWRDASFSFREVFPFYPVDDDARFIRGEGRYSCDPELDDPVGQPIERVPEDAVQEFQWPRDREELAAWIAERPRGRVRMTGRPLPEAARSIRAVWMTRFDGRGGRIVHIVRASSSGDDSKSEETTPEGDTTPKEERAYRLLSSFTPTEVEWQWKGYIPRGKLTLLAGDGSMGKSIVSLDLAARITSNRPMPDGSRAANYGGVLIVAAEDDVGDTILPRLFAMGGDPDRIMTVKRPRDDAGNLVPFVLPDDLYMIRRSMEQYERDRGEPVVLVIIDPITGHLAEDIRSNVDPSVRRALLPLAELLTEKHASGLLIIHTNKDESKSLVNRIMGSKAFFNLARSVLVFAHHPDEEDTRVMGRAKSNIAAPVPGWCYRIEEHPEWNVGVARWGDSEWLSLERLLIERKSRERAPERNRAEDFLVRVLDGKVIGAQEVKSMAVSEGITEITLRRAADHLGIEKVRVRDDEGKTQGWKWRLPR